MHEDLIISQHAAVADAADVADAVADCSSKTQLL